MPRERWLEKRKQEILKTAYFHVVFTLPHALNTIVLNNKRIMLTILFRAVSQTLLTFLGFSKIPCSCYAPALIRASNS